ncbi:MAG: sensor histidine kinase [Draconibacterium sp.]
MKRSFRGEIFFYYILVFVLFTITVLVFQYQREKSYKHAQLENTLDNITDITDKFIQKNHLLEDNHVSDLSDLIKILPETNPRITIISKEGKVLYDSFVKDYTSMENHFNRPEVAHARKKGTGANIRTSATTNQEFYYYARMFPHYYVRAALVFDVTVKDFLKTSTQFITFMVILFLIVGLILVFVTVKLSFTITKLKDFALRAGSNELVEFDTKFPANELGIISGQIIQIYNNLKKTKDDLAKEKEKLFNHLDALDEGIAFFSPRKIMTLSNGKFIEMVNLISKKKVVSNTEMLENSSFKKLHTFLDRYLETNFENWNEKVPKLDYTTSKEEKFFRIYSIIFADRSFEIVITDVTRLEKRRLMKQQLTSNIAHELKTPLSSIRGYLETILENWPIPEEKQKYFLEKAFFQSERLTALINDVSLINNIEDAGELFEMKQIDIKKITNDIYEYFSSKIEHNKIEFVDEVKANTFINGNESLLFSVFQNLVENSITYGGTGIRIHIKCYHKDERYYYFSYSDTGGGIPKEHLPRIFERFYRIDKGRSRTTGGTGLGLAIVKNAITLHNGRVSVKNRPKGGVEFLFSLSIK